MPSTDELNIRLTAVENIINSAVILPKFVCKLNDSIITDKTGYWCVGQDPDIHDNALFMGLSNTASPTVPADFDEFLIVK